MITLSLNNFLNRLVVVLSLVELLEITFSTKTAVSFQELSSP